MHCIYDYGICYDFPVTITRSSGDGLLKYQESTPKLEKQLFVFKSFLNINILGNLCAFIMRQWRELKGNEGGRGMGEGGNGGSCGYVTCVLTIRLLGWLLVLIFSHMLYLYTFIPFYVLGLFHLMVKI